MLKNMTNNYRNEKNNLNQRMTKSIFKNLVGNLKSKAQYIEDIVI